MAIKVGEFFFAIGFGKPDTRNLEKASKSAQRAIKDAQKAVAEGAEDAEEKIEAASKAVARHGRKAKKEITGWGVGMRVLAKEAKKAAKEYTAAWREPEKLTEAWGKALGRAKTALVGLAGGVTAAAGATGLLVKHTAESDLQLTKWAESLGLTASELSKLQQAAGLLGIESEDVNDSIKDLRAKLVELANEGTGAALESFRDLGIEIKDLQGKDAATQLGVIGDALNKVDPQTAVKAMDELLSDVGVRMIPFLKRGSAGMAELGAEAERLGLVVSDSAAASSADFAKTLGEVTAMVKALVADVARGLMPTIRGYLQIAKQWIGDNRTMLRQRVREWLDKIVQAAKTFAEIAVSLGEALSGLVTALGGLDNALTAAALAFGALQVAALGLPGVVLAASAGIAYGLSQIILSIQGVNLELDRLDARRKSQQATGALIDQAQGQGLDKLTDEEFKAQTDEILRKGIEGGESNAARKEVLQLTKIREGQKQISATRAENQARVEARRGAADAELFAQVEERLRARNKRKNLKLGEAGIQTALTKFKQTYRETGSTRAAGEAAGEALDGLAGSRGKPGKEKLDTSRAEELFGADLRRIAARDGAGEAAISESVKAAAEAFKGGATEGVARAAAYSRLGQATGREYKTLGPGQDTLLSTILGKDVPDIEMGKLALGASPQVLQVTITNNFDIDAPITIPGSGSPSAVAGAASDHIKGIVGDIAKSTKLAKVVWAR